MPVGKHREQDCWWSACCFCLDTLFSLQLEDLQIWPHSQEPSIDLNPHLAVHVCGGVMKRGPHARGICVHGAGLQSPGPAMGLAAVPFPSPLDAASQQVRAASGTWVSKCEKCEPQAWEHGGCGRRQMCYSHPECAWCNRSALP